MLMITKQKLAAMIDHTNLKADATDADMKKLCDEAVTYGFAMVAINSGQTARCHAYLKGTHVHTGAAIGFPLGQQSTAVKVFETEDAIRNGADEIDYVVNLTDVKDGRWDAVKDEMSQIVQVCRQHHVLIKVIFETCYLTKEQIRRLAETALEVKPDFIKTSTGFGTAGATVENVQLMKSVVGDAVKVKAAGGIRTLADALAMIDAGAERIGTSHGVDLIKELK